MSEEFDHFLKRNFTQSQRINQRLSTTEHLFNEGYDLKASKKKNDSLFRVISIMYRWIICVLYVVSIWPCLFWFHGLYSTFWKRRHISQSIRQYEQFKRQSCMGELRRQLHNFLYRRIWSCLAGQFHSITEDKTTDWALLKIYLIKAIDFKAQYAVSRRLRLRYSAHKKECLETSSKRFNETQ